MTAFAYAEESFFPEDCGRGAGSAGNGSLSASMGTFSLRRAHYFNETAYLNEAKCVGEGEAGQDTSLSAEQQLALTKLILNGDFVAKQKLIARSLPLVVDIAKRYTNRGVPLLNLLKEGKRGLIYALDEFKVEDRFHFANFAAQCIRQYIERAIANQNNSTGIFVGHFIA